MAKILFLRITMPRAVLLSGAWAMSANPGVFIAGKGLPRTGEKA